MIYSAQFKSQQDEVSRVVTEAEASWSKAGIDADLSGELCLILAEALNNVVEHAYGYDEGGDIQVDLERHGAEVLMRIVDSGPAFQPPQDVELGPSGENLCDLPEGGFGWGLIQMLADRISLERIDDKNHLRLYKAVAA